MIPYPKRGRAILPGFALYLLVGCGGVSAQPRVGPEASGLLGQPVEEAENQVAGIEEPPLEDRWRSPFAVSSVGRTAPREPREVAIIGADPVIAEALAEIRSDADAALDADDDREPNPSRLSDGDASDDPADDAEPPAEQIVRVTHRVRPGDTLFGIARQYNVTPEAIRAANDLENDRVRLGQLLSIPAPESGS